MSSFGYSKGDLIDLKRFYYTVLVKAFKIDGSGGGLWHDYKMLLRCVPRRCDLLIKSDAL